MGQALSIPGGSDNQHMKVIRLLALRTGRLYPPGKIPVTHFWWGTGVAQWLRCCVTNRKVAGSIPDNDWNFFKI